MDASGALLRRSREGLEDLHGRTTLQAQELHHGSPCSADRMWEKCHAANYLRSFGGFRMADLILPRARMGFTHLNSNCP